MNQSYQCFDCAQDSKLFSLKELEAHIASDHLNIFPFECEQCPHARFSTEYALATHKIIDHKISEFSIEYRYTARLGAKRRQLAQKLERCKTMKLSHAAGSSCQLNVNYNRPSQNQMDVLSHRTLKVFVSERATLTEASSSSCQINVNYNRPSQTQNASCQTPLKPFVSKSATITQPDQPERITLPTTKCIPSGSGTRYIRKKSVECILCHNFVIDDRECKIYHTNTRHGFFKLFECGYCNRQFETTRKSELLRHIKRFHKIEGTVDTSRIVDHRNQHMDDLRILCNKCFPT